MRTLRLYLVLLSTVLAGCQTNKCQTPNIYTGTGVNSGTIAYGNSGTHEAFTCGGLGDLPHVECMQNPDSCTAISFGSIVNHTCTALELEVEINPFQNGALIQLPANNVTVKALLYDMYLPFDAGTALEPLTLVTGTVTVSISLNNLDAHFNLSLARPNGDLVTITDGRVALLDGYWTKADEIFQ